MLNLLAVLVWYGMRFHDGETGATVALAKDPAVQRDREVQNR